MIVGCNQPDVGDENSGHKFDVMFIEIKISIHRKKYSMHACFSCWEMINGFSRAGSHSAMRTIGVQCSHAEGAGALGRPHGCSMVLRRHELNTNTKN